MRKMVEKNLKNKFTVQITEFIWSSLNPNVVDVDCRVEQIVKNCTI